MSIATTEAAILARLRALFGNRVRSIGAVPGEFSDELLRTMLTLAPFALLHFNGGANPRPGAAVAGISGQWEVYVGTAHASGQEARRLGDALQIGAYEMLHIACAGVHNLAVADDGTLQLQRVENLFTGAVDRQGLTVYGAVFSNFISFDLVAAESLDDFETFHAQYDVPAHSTPQQHQAWLAANYTTSSPDAQDTVTLPTQV
jgi:phage gp37-like protein